MGTNVNNVTANKLSPGWYIFSLARKGGPIAGPFSSTKDANKELEKLERTLGTCFIAGIDILNRKQRRAKAREDKSAKRSK